MTPAKVSPEDVRMRVQRELLWIKPRDLMKNERNWREHPDAQIGVVSGLLKEVGVADALIAYRSEANGGALTLVDGHLRKDLAPDVEWPVLVLDVNDDEALELLALIDPSAAMAEANRQRLEAALSGIYSQDDAIQKMIEGMRQEYKLGVASGSEEEDTAALLESTEPVWEGVEVGQEWLIPSKTRPDAVHRLFVGDSRSPDIWQRITAGSVRMVWTDPPYGVDYVGKTKKALKIVGDRRDDSLVDLLRGAFKAAADACTPGACWYVAAPGGPSLLVFLAALAELSIFHEMLVWVKNTMVLGHADFHGKHEVLLYGWMPGGEHTKPQSRNATTVWEFDKPSASREHPTMKPVELVRQSIEFSSSPGDVILDPFCGSGTTLVACEDTRRVGIGIEIDPRYAAVILRRLDRLGLTPKLMR